VGPYTLTVTGGKESTPVKFEDVLVGEVWVCSGQSNMEMPLNSPSPFWRAADADAEQAAANYPEIRLYNAIAKRQMSPGAPRQETNGPGWAVCSPENVKDFSALGYFYAMADSFIRICMFRSGWSTPAGMVPASSHGFPRKPTERPAAARNWRVSSRPACHLQS